jgi:hypothetical protein
MVCRIIKDTRPLADLFVAITQTPPCGMVAQSANGTLKAGNNPRKRKYDSAIPVSVLVRRSLRVRANRQA